MMPAAAGGQAMMPPAVGGGTYATDPATMAMQKRLNKAAVNAGSDSKNKVWILHGRMPTGTGDTVEDLQALLGDVVEITGEMTKHLRSIGGFSVSTWLLHAASRVELSTRMLVAHKLEKMSCAITKMLSLGLDRILDPERTACFARIVALRAAFDVVANPLRWLSRQNEAVPSLPPVQSILHQTIDRDLSLWASKLAICPMNNFSTCRRRPSQPSASWRRWCHLCDGWSTSALRWSIIEDDCEHQHRGNGRFKGGQQEEAGTDRTAGDM